MKIIQLKNKTDFKISDYIYYNNLNYIIPNEVEKLILDIDPILELITN